MQININKILNLHNIIFMSKQIIVRNNKSSTYLYTFTDNSGEPPC